MAKRQYKGTLQTPGGRPQNVDLVVDRVPQISEAEVAAGISWVDDRYRDNDPRRYGAAGDGTTDDTAALNRMAQVITQRGYGRIDGKGLVYSVEPALLGVVGTFTSVNNLEIVNAKFVDTQTYSLLTAESATLFQLVGCNNVRAAIEVETQDCSADYSEQSGLVALRLQQGTRGIDFQVEMTGGLVAVLAQKQAADPDSHKSGVGFINLRCTSVHYPLNCVLSGVGIRGIIEATDCGRNFIMYGSRQVELFVRSKDQQVASILRTVSGDGCEDVTIHYRDRDTTDSNGTGNPAISLDWTDATAATHRNIKINFDVYNPTTNGWGSSLQIRKLNGGSADTTSRGHILDGLEVTGISEFQGTGDHIDLQSGTFTGSDEVRKIRFHNLQALGGGHIRLPSELLGVLQDTAVFDQVYCSGDLKVENGSSQKAVFLSCRANSYGESTSDTHWHTYFACEITSGGSGSVFNKTLVNCNVPEGSEYPENRFSSGKFGGFFAVASNRILGDQTSATNAFRVWLNGFSAHFRLHYFVVDNEAAGAGTREEIAGVKSFSVKMTAAGVWTTYMTAADEVTERTLNPGTAALTVGFVNNADSDGDGDGYITVATSTMSGGNARGAFYLEMLTNTADGHVEAA